MCSCTRNGAKLLLLRQEVWQDKSRQQPRGQSFLWLFAGVFTNLGHFVSKDRWQATSYSTTFLHTLVKDNVGNRLSNITGECSTNFKAVKRAATDMNTRQYKWHLNALLTSTAAVILWDKKLLNFCCRNRLFLCIHARLPSFLSICCNYAVAQKVLRCLYQSIPQVMQQVTYTGTAFNCSSTHSTELTIHYVIVTPEQFSHICWWNRQHATHRN